MDNTDFSSSGSSFFDKFKNMSTSNYIIIIFVCILILAFLGFNIFVYLAEGTQDITNITKPLLGKIFGILGLTFKEVVDVSAEGTRAVVNTTADVVDVTTKSIQNAVDKPFEEAEAKKQGQTQGQTQQPSQAPSTIKGQPVQQPQKDIMQNNTLNKALNTAAIKGSSSQNNQEYEADESTSSIQRGTNLKSGWCYIGEDRGFRTCAEVGVNDTCMSGDIFPSQEICINPNLRP
jgi:hypothetical protein